MKVLDRIAMDRRWKAGGEDDTTELSSFPLEPSAAGAEPTGRNLGNLWRRLTLPKRIENWSLTSLQQRLVKTGGRLVKHARYKWAISGCAGGGWHTVGSASDDKSFHGVANGRDGVYYGSVFGSKKEISANCSLSGRRCPTEKGFEVCRAPLKSPSWR